MGYGFGPGRRDESCSKDGDLMFATITGVFDDGVTLQFDDGSASTKHYKCNTGQVFKAGDRVRITKHGDSFFVESVVGAPATTSTVANLAGGATTAQTVTKVNELLAALRARNIID